MPIRHKFELYRTTEKVGWEKRTVVHMIEYRLMPKPYKLLNRNQLPKSHEFESWESEDDFYFKVNGNFYNLKEFCKHGQRVIPGPKGGAQLASNGYFQIASYNGKIYPVIWEESCHFAD